MGRHSWAQHVLRRADTGFFSLRFGIAEQMQFARRLSVYLSAGVPILEALMLLSEDTKTKGSARILKSLVSSVSEGRTLSSGLRNYPKQISMLSVSMIEVGERSGTLHDSLSHLASTLRKQQVLQRKLMNAMLYPIIILLTTLGIVSFLILYAFPKIVPILRGFDSSLPLTTRTLISLSDGLSRYGILLLTLVCILAIAGWFLYRNPRIRRALDSCSLDVPVLGPLMRAYHLASISRILSTLLRSGAGVLVALELSCAASRNLAYADALRAARDGVLGGERLAESLSTYGRCFPRMYIQMVETGERTGTLSTALSTLTEQYEDEFDSSSTSLSTLIEPVLMVVMGLLVGFIALAIITPIYQITQDMHG